MKKINEMQKDDSCFNKANDDEFMFILLGRDKAAPYAIRCWASERIRLGNNKAEDEQIVNALILAQQIEKSHAEEGQQVAGLIEMIPVESSQILAIGHCIETNTLAITFKNYKGESSSTYHYSNFTYDQFNDFKNAESIGKYFGSKIKSNSHAHPYKKISS